jgi:predicted Ser/Thr protein kinase
MTQALIDSYHSEVEISGSQGVPLARFREEDIVLEQQIGQGSFATVYKGKWLGATVAIKRFMISNKNEAMMQEFVKEASLMGTLKHPNIV